MIENMNMEEVTLCQNFDTLNRLCQHTHSWEVLRILHYLFEAQNSSKYYLKIQFISRRKHNASPILNQLDNAV
jgi:hypothetical protein